MFNKDLGKMGHKMRTPFKRKKNKTYLIVCLCHQASLTDSGASEGLTPKTSCRLSVVICSSTMLASLGFLLHSQRHGLHSWKKQ